MFELQFKPNGSITFPKIEWNNEELKAEVLEAVKDYQNVVVTTDGEKDAKEMRAKLNKLRTSLETARKEMKNKAMQPVSLFESQIKEIEKPIDDAIGNIDKQLKEIDENRRSEKKDGIENLFRESMESEYIPEWVTLEQVWNDKWLNKTYSMEAIKKDIVGIGGQIEKDISMLKALPEYSFEAIESYKATLNVQESLKMAADYVEMERKKAEAQKAKEDHSLPQSPQKEESTSAETNNQEGGKIVIPDDVIDEKLHTFYFRVDVTAEQAKLLGDFCMENGIKLIRLQTSNE